MTSRTEKGHDLRDRQRAARDVIRSLNYWPLDWGLSVVFRRHAGWRASTRVAGIKARREGRLGTMELRLPPDWLETVHAQGRAVFQNRFVLAWRPVVPPIPGPHPCGAEQVALCHWAEWPRYGHITNSLVYAVEWGGQWATGGTPEEALSVLQGRFLEALVGRDLLNPPPF